MKTYTVTEYEREDYDRVREEMTNQEAIQLLDRIERGWIPDYDFSGSEDDFDKYTLHVALYKAMEVLGMKENKNEF